MVQTGSALTGIAIPCVGLLLGTRMEFAKLCIGKDSDCLWEGLRFHPQGEERTGCFSRGLRRSELLNLIPVLILTPAIHDGVPAWNDSTLHSD